VGITPLNFKHGIMRILKETLIKATLREAAFSRERRVAGCGNPESPFRTKYWIIAPRSQ
jgi:hypothetical protein